MKRRYEIEYKDDRFIHIWDIGGVTWYCAEYDHGPMCRRCIPLQEAVKIVSDELRERENIFIQSYR
jgi:hypothetical protein